ncbi:endonuclease domain-containing protein [Mucilaginibacter lutimaris]|uniref:Endonuclease domain-containing protein n=1 Tax=Mucilaginibacter lutimaris TaxID=931629 RepID=A0ABW2ZCV2_9SPHI
MKLPMVKIIPYNPKLKALARKLRKDMTFGETLLWNELKEDKLWGFDFDRQRCIDNYIVDFYCKPLMLAIEIDGMSHNREEALNKDELRQQKLEGFGITFIRFSEADVKHDMANVIRAISGVIVEIIRKNKSINIPKEFPMEVFNN